MKTTHPNPQFARKNFVSLNGKWQFDIASHLSKDFFNEILPLEINVPFCPESELSGIGHTDFIKECVYKRTFTLDEVNAAERIFIHFGAVDYISEVYINGSLVGRHIGGQTPFRFDITKLVTKGENQIVLFVYDDVLDNTPSGKQSNKLESYGCFYTRVTGIWQTVYIERTPLNYIKSFRFFPDINKTSVGVEVDVTGEGDFIAEVFFADKKVGSIKQFVSRKGKFDIQLSEKHLWDIGKGNLYDVKLSYCGDEVTTYFGLREVRYDGLKFMLNDKSVFQRLVLDQGYYPDGIYTAPSEDAMIADIKLGMDTGFNGARLHQKVFDPLFLYHCDRLGYLVWGEFPSWGVEYSNLEALGKFMDEWREVVERDFNHPSIITWCPLNEVWLSERDRECDGNVRANRDVRFVETVYDFTKTLDSTRPCVDVSGGFHGRRTDLFDFHSYDNEPNVKKSLDELVKYNILDSSSLYPDKKYGENIAYAGQPINLSEYGGASFVKKDLSYDEKVDWGYVTVSQEDDFIKRFNSLTLMILDCLPLSGFCYTQLYDVEQEKNGLYTYDRKPKFSKNGYQSMFAAINAPSKIEK